MMSVHPCLQIYAIYKLIKVNYFKVVIYPVISRQGKFYRCENRIFSFGNNNILQILSADVTVRQIRKDWGLGLN